MSVPLSWNAAGLPIGVQLQARFGDEATLFRVAAQLESGPPVGRPAPAGPRRRSSEISDSHAKLQALPDSALGETPERCTVRVMALTYCGSTAFRRELERRVASYFEAGNRSRHGTGRMLAKTVILLAWLAASYVATGLGRGDLVAGRSARDLARAGDGGHRLQHPARRQPRRLFAPPRAEQGGGAVAQPAGGRRLLLALQAQHRPPQLPEHLGRGQRHLHGPVRAHVAARQALLVPPLPVHLHLGAVFVAGGEVAAHRRFSLDDPPRRRRHLRRPAPGMESGLFLGGQGLLHDAGVRHPAARPAIACWRWSACIC